MSSGTPSIGEKPHNSKLKLAHFSAFSGESWYSRATSPCKGLLDDLRDPKHLAVWYILHWRHLVSFQLFRGYNSSLLATMAVSGSVPTNHSLYLSRKHLLKHRNSWQSWLYLVLTKHALVSDHRLAFKFRLWLPKPLLRLLDETTSPKTYKFTVLRVGSCSIRLAVRRDKAFCK